MGNFSFLRKPVRLVLYGVLLALLTTAALLFGWQYHLNGIILDYAIDTYAFIGTIVRSDGQILDSNIDRDMMELYGIEEAPEMGGPAFLEEIPAELVAWLEQCEAVARIDNRRTQAAQIGTYYRANAKATAQTALPPDSMMSDSTAQYCFVEGIIERADRNYDDGDTASDSYIIQVRKMWNDPAYAHATMVVDFDRLSAEPALEVGQRIFWVSSYVYGGNGLPMERQAHAYTTGYMEKLTGQSGYESPHSYILIPDDVDTAAYIWDYLESIEMADVLRQQATNRYSVTVRRTQDMNMIPIFAQGRAKCYEGRVLNPTDTGKKVCVISSALAQRNTLSVGDTVQLAIADGCYTIQMGYKEVDGWESGTMRDGDTALEYGDYEDYEIVGIYSIKGRRPGNVLHFPYTDLFLPNVLHSPYSDLFVPGDTDSAAEVARPYTFSFRIPGPDYLDFVTAAEPVLAEYGYSLMVEDTGWDDVKESFYTMQTQQKLMLICAVAAFGAAVVVFAVLAAAHCRYEFGLRRLMGANMGEALGIYAAVFAVTGIPGALAALAAAWLGGMKMIEGAALDGSALVLPSAGECAAILAGWTLAELAVIGVVILVLALMAQRRGLLRLIRR